MRLVKLRLGASQPFWFLDDIIQLSSDKRESDYINIDSLSDDHMAIIENSMRMGHIRLYNAYGSRVFKDLYSPEFIVEEEDLQPQEPEEVIATEDHFMPEIISITVSDREKEALEDEPLYQQKEISEARLLLSKNGNTVRAAIKKCSKAKRAFLYACLDLEKVGRKRAGVMKDIVVKLESLN